MPRPLFKRSGSWDRLQDWPKSSLLDQCNGAPFFLDANDNSWLNTARKTLSTSPWPGFLSVPLVSPICPEISSSTRDGQPNPLPHAKCDSKSWSISLDVSQFCPDEIEIKVKECYLEITEYLMKDIDILKGKHEEKKNEHGTISRSFTRKYKLPAEVDLQQMSSSLSPERVLLVEAPLGASSTSFPKETVIPIQINKEQ